MFKLNTFYQKYMKLWLKKTSPLYTAVLSEETTLKNYINKQDALFWYSKAKDNESLSEAKRAFFATLPCDEKDMEEIISFFKASIKQADKKYKTKGLNYWLLGGSMEQALKEERKNTEDSCSGNTTMTLEMMDYTIKMQFEKNER